VQAIFNIKTRNLLLAAKPMQVEMESLISKDSQIVEGDKI